jgi:hypothetical protein
MTLTKPVKLLVGLLTLLVMVFPIALFVLWGFMMLPVFLGDASRELPFEAFDAVFALAFPLMCLFTLAMYGLTAFYVSHAIKNQGGSDVIRIVALLAVFFFPYLGMPFYYIVFILLPRTPSWALKPQPLT